MRLISGHRYGRYGAYTLSNIQIFYNKQLCGLLGQYTEREKTHKYDKDPDNERAIKISYKKSTDFSVDFYIDTGIAE